MKKEDILTDLHCHILPGIDDGAADLSVTRALLEEEKRQGVTQIAFTPHFYADMKSKKDFMKDRYQAAVSAAPVLEELGIEWSAGAEVRLVSELLDMNLENLVYVDTKYFLLEWPFNQYPIWGDEVVDKLLKADITPIFAHIERYDWFFHHPDTLAEYIEEGCLCQVNSSTVLRNHTGKAVLDLIKNGYVHLICSDAHNMDKRPPTLLPAFEKIEKELGRSYAEELMTNADDIFHGRPVTPRTPGTKKKKFHLFG